jgi:hypothetical protein
MKYNKPRRLILLIFNTQLTSGDLSKALNLLPSGAIITGTHYNSAKSQAGLIISHWFFDPVPYGQLLPEYTLFVDTTKGAWIESSAWGTGIVSIPEWVRSDTRSWIRKLFDFFFN